MLLGFALAASALAADPPLAGGETLEVPASSRVIAARAALERTLRDLGYTRSRRDGPWTIYLSPGAGHPTLRVHDDGWFLLARNPLSVAVGPVAGAGGTLGAGVKFTFSGPRVGDGNASRLVDAIRDDIRALNDAVAGEAMDIRESYDIPAELAEIWGGPGPAATRRAALLAYWDERTDTPEGERARAAVVRFLDAVVQTSATPFTVDEIRAFNARRTAAAELRVRPAE